MEYIVHNGMGKDLSVLQETPFTGQGSIVEIFTDLTVWMGVRRIIEAGFFICAAFGEKGGFGRQICPVSHFLLPSGTALSVFFAHSSVCGGCD